MALPTPAPLGASSRYFVAGTRQVSWVPTIANINSPTSAELSAGTDLTGQIGAIAGFDESVNFVAAPDMGSRYEPQIAGRIQSQNSSISFYASSNSSDVRNLLTLNLAGYIVIYTEGIATGNKMNVFPVTVGSVAPDPNMEAVALILVSFGITKQPVFYAAIPTV